MEHLLFKATLVAAVFTFFIILLTRKENSYLGTGGTPGNKKLMVVDQTSGAISFLNDSVEGVNQKFLQNDATQAALLEQLFGPNLDGLGGTLKTRMDALSAGIQATVAETYATSARVEAIDASYDTRVDGKVGWNDKIALWETAMENPVVGFKKTNDDGTWATYDATGWHRAALEFKPANTSNLKIIKGNPDADEH